MFRIAIVLALALAIMPVAAQDTATSRCRITGSGKHAICQCFAANGRPKSAPMWRCR